MRRSRREDSWLNGEVVVLASNRARNLAIRELMRMLAKIIWQVEKSVDASMLTEYDVKYVILLLLSVAELEATANRQLVAALVRCGLCLELHHF